MKLRKTFNGNVKAVSPVIATIIIVAIAIVMSIAVAYWMLGLGGAFTRYEKLEFQSGYAIKDPDGNFSIRMRLKNTGSADATLDIIFLNGIPQQDVGKNYLLNMTFTKEGATTPAYSYSNSNTKPPESIGLTLAPGEAVEGTIRLLGNQTTSIFKSGMSVELKIQTVAGNTYPKVIVLP